MIDHAEIVQRAITGTEDREAAILLLAEWALADGAILHSLTVRYHPSSMREVCTAAVRAEESAVRRDATQSAALAAEEARVDERSADLSRWSRTLLEKFDIWALPSGTRLKRATMGEIGEAVKFHAEQRAAHAVKERFYQRVMLKMQAQGAAPDARVGDLCSDMVLAELLVEAQGR